MTSKDSDTGPTSQYCYRKMCGPGMERMWLDPEDLYSSWSTHVLTQNSVVALPIWPVVLPLAGIYWTHNADYSSAMVEPDSHTSCVWGKGCGFPPRYGGYHPNDGGYISSSGRSRSARTLVSLERAMGTETCSLENWHQKPAECVTYDWLRSNQFMARSHASTIRVPSSTLW